MQSKVFSPYTKSLICVYLRAKRAYSYTPRLDGTAAALEFALRCCCLKILCATIIGVAPFTYFLVCAAIR